MKIGFIPLGNKIIIKESEPEAMTAAGIIIPDASRVKLPRGEVIAIGTGEENRPMKLKIGDKVLYHPSAGQELILKEGTFLMMNEIEVYGIFRD